MKVITFFTFFFSVTLLLSFQTKPKFDLKASMAKGKDVYLTYCMSCHMEQGEGLEDVYPPLAKADYMMADKKRLVQQILYGANGPMKVNGKTYNGEMTGFDLSDQEASDLANYIRNSFGNKGSALLPEEVKAARKK
jgi:mono/diheme cytochrome c family protein